MMIRTPGGTAPLAPAAPVVHIVEDDDDARNATAKLLRAAGYAVKSYASGAAFLTEMPIVEPGCVLLDVQLPDASGLELHEMLSRAHDVLPVIFVTGHGDIPMSVRAIQAGAVDFLTKPVQAASLLPAVAQAVARDAHDRAARAHAREVQAKYRAVDPTRARGLRALDQWSTEQAGGLRSRHQRAYHQGPSPQHPGKAWRAVDCRLD